MLSIAKDIDVVIQDGNAGVVDKMLELDYKRSKDSELLYKHNKCCPSSDLGMDAQGNVGNMAQIVDNIKQPTRTGIAEVEIEDQEKGWSKVGPRKKNKRIKQ